MTFAAFSSYAWTTEHCQQILRHPLTILHHIILLTTTHITFSKLGTGQLYMSGFLPINWLSAFSSTNYYIIHQPLKIHILHRDEIETSQHVHLSYLFIAQFKFSFQQKDSAHQIFPALSGYGDHLSFILEWNMINRIQFNALFIHLCLLSNQGKVTNAQEKMRDAQYLQNGNDTMWSNCLH